MHEFVRASAPRSTADRPTAANSPRNFQRAVTQASARDSRALDSEGDASWRGCMKPMACNGGSEEAAAYVKHQIGARTGSKYRMSWGFVAVYI